MLKGNTLAVKHAKDVVVRNHEQLRRIREGLVLGEPARVSMAVGGDDRQVAYVGVEPVGDGACAGFGGEKPVFVEDRHRAASVDALLAGQLLQSSGLAQLIATPSIICDLPSAMSRPFANSSSSVVTTKPPGVEHNEPDYRFALPAPDRWHVCCTPATIPASCR